MISGASSRLVRPRQSGQLLQTALRNQLVATGVSTQPMCPRPRRLGLSSVSLSGIVLCLQKYKNGHLPHGLALCRTVGIEHVSASFCLRFVYWLTILHPSLTTVSDVLPLSSLLFAIMRRFSLLNTHRMGARLAGYKLVLRIAIVFAARSQLRC